MSFFNPEIPLKEKVVSKHPWERYIKDAYASTYKYGHNSAKNPIYPPPKRGKVPDPQRAKFTVIGNRITKEFIYCVNLVKGLHKYRWRQFDTPVIRAVNGVEWRKIWNDLKVEHGGVAYCLQSEVAILLDGHFVGGERELKKLVEEKYIFYSTPDYYSEAIKQFADYIKSSGRPCAYLQIAADDTILGTLIFMLYSDIVPRTCENFLRLCKTNKGGYAGTPVHRIVKDGWIQCGGFGLKDSGLDCENFIVPHDRRGVLAMANNGRHLDCSTQFFVLLQPADWMARKYVAFGQLIEGERTLQKIEAIPTWYESPTKKITIFGAGILNFECQDIVINKSTHQYIEGHVENLFTIRELFYEALLEKVFLETEARSMHRLNDKMLEEGAELPEKDAKNLRATQRFMRKKEEIDKQIEKSHTQLSDGESPATDKANQDFDVEEYEYIPDEYSFQQVTANASESILVKPEKPYYLPFTDVPYPGEVDSTFDLKRLLQGDYCHEIDLEKDAPKKRVKTKRPWIPAEAFDIFYSSTSTESSREDLDSDDEKEIKKYLQSIADTACHAGKIVKSMSRRSRYKLYVNQGGSDLISDEIQRKYKFAKAAYQNVRGRTVFISVPSKDKKKRIRRRQTGFIRKEDMDVIHKFSMGPGDKHHEESSEDSDDVDKDEVDKDEVDKDEVDKDEVDKDEVDKDEVDKNEVDKDESSEKPVQISGDELEKPHDSSDLSSIKSGPELRVDEEEEQLKRSTHVHMSTSVESKASGHMPIRLRRSLGNNEDDARCRPSVLMRLIDNVCVDDYAPTLKDYRPMDEGCTNLFLTHTQTFLIRDDNDPREKYKRHSLELEGSKQSIDKVLNLQHGKKVYRKISTDYVKTIDHIEQKALNSLRSIEYAKRRPAISVPDYKKKNQDYQERLKLELKNNKVTSKV